MTLCHSWETQSYTSAVVTLSRLSFIIQMLLCETSISNGTSQIFFWATVKLDGIVLGVCARCSPPGSQTEQDRRPVIVNYLPSSSIPFKCPAHGLLSSTFLCCVFLSPSLVAWKHSCRHSEVIFTNLLGCHSNKAGWYHYIKLKATLNIFLKPLFKTWLHKALCSMNLLSSPFTTKNSTSFGITGVLLSIIFCFPQLSHFLTPVFQCRTIFQDYILTLTPCLSPH